ncbi:hypothetical protein RJ640_001597, partial [Escallonia rubra]
MRGSCVFGDGMEMSLVRVGSGKGVYTGVGSWVFGERRMGVDEAAVVAAMNAGGLREEHHRLLCKGVVRDELETHSKPGSVSVCVHYGRVRSNDLKVIAEPDIVLTTYGVLTAAYKTDGECSIFHKVDWYRVVLDEAHTVKSSRTQGAQAAFKLSSHRRWCLTGTLLQLPPSSQAQ